MHVMTGPIIWLAAALALPSFASAASVVRPGRVRAELLAHAPEGVAPGKPVWFGLNSSTPRTGTPTGRTPATPGCRRHFAWTLPAGVQPATSTGPRRSGCRSGRSSTSAMTARCSLPVPVTIPRPSGRRADVKLDADWLVCKIDCIPQSGTFELDAARRRSAGAHAAWFRAARWPRADAAGAGGEARADDGALDIEGADCRPLRGQGSPRVSRDGGRGR